MQSSGCGLALCSRPFKDIFRYAGYCEDLGRLEFANHCLPTPSGGSRVDGVLFSTWFSGPRRPRHFSPLEKKSGTSNNPSQYAGTSEGKRDATLRSDLVHVEPLLTIAELISFTTTRWGIRRETRWGVGIERSEEKREGVVWSRIQCANSTEWLFMPLQCSLLMICA